MYKTIPLLLFITLFCLQGVAGDQELINVYNRPHKSLNGEWKYIVDPYENGYYNYRYEPYDQMENPGSGAFFVNAKAQHKTDLVEYNFDKSKSIQVPGDWNSQKENLYYYEGSIWYKKSFDYSRSAPENRVFVHFGAVNYKAEVYLNGQKLGTHVGGFTPFHFEVTDLLKEEGNFLIVKVDNTRKREGVPTLNTDWWNYGGITRDVNLVETPPTYIEDYQIQLDPDDDQTITGFVRLAGEDPAQENLTLSIPALDIDRTLATNSEGLAKISIRVDQLEYWSPGNPHLYQVHLAAGEERMNDRIGFRTIQTEGSDIVLNGEPVFLKGISIHEESPFSGGRAHSRADARQLLQWAKELGCNYVRLAHYPHNEHMVRMADEIGLLVWKEIPVYWTIDWDNPDTYRNAENQLTEMINRDKNRASVIIWSMANETPTSSARLEFLTSLAEKTRELDPTRLISAALEQSNYQGDPTVRTIDDPFADVVDILSFNQYIGWYDGLPGKCSQITWKIDQDKPVMISEVGAGAKHGYHGDSLTRWSEEYQAYLYRETLKMVGKIDQLSGISPWILVDFRSPRRQLPDIQEGWNRKGLISEQGERKKAFYVLQRFYEKKSQDQR